MLRRENRPWGVCDEAYLCAIGVIGVGRIQHGGIFDKRIHLLVQYVEVAGVAQLKGSRQGEGVHPSEGRAKKVAGNIQTLIAPPQLHHVAARTGGAEKRHTLRLPPRPSPALPLLLRTNANRV